MTEWEPPPGSQLTIEDARRLLSGDLGHEYRAIIKRSCAPLFWHRPHGGQPGPILHNGTITFMRTPQRLLGVTAAHVINEYVADNASEPVLLQIGDAALNPPDIIDVSARVDLATVAISESDIRAAGKSIVPLSVWPPMVPQEGRGILLGGYPGNERRQIEPGAAEWGLFTALGIARTVVHPQITWLVEREWASGDLPENADLGGISGGPLIGLFESGGVQHFRLSGIITEAHPLLEKTYATRADLILPGGTIERP